MQLSLPDGKMRNRECMNAVADDDCPADDDAVEHTNDEGCEDPVGSAI